MSVSQKCKRGCLTDGISMKGYEIDRGRVEKYLPRESLLHPKPNAVLPRSQPFRILPHTRHHHFYASTLSTSSFLFRSFSGHYAHSGALTCVTRTPSESGTHDGAVSGATEEARRSSRFRLKPNRRSGNGRNGKRVFKTGLSGGGGGRRGRIRERAASHSSHSGAIICRPSEERASDCLSHNLLLICL